MSGKPPKQKWDNFAKKLAKNRLGPRAKSDETGSGDFLTVQRLSASVEGKCQKYTRIGPLTMVPRYGSEPTLDNIKESCKRDFEVANLECDVLAGERGPSYTEASQIKSWKVIHVRLSASRLNDPQNLGRVLHTRKCILGNSMKNLSPLKSF